MFQRRPKRFRRRSNGRSHMQRNPSGVPNRIRPHSFTNGYNKGNFKNSLSAEKLFEKYTSLAKEAMSSGDKTLSENYLQHADHFMRVIEDKNKNRNLNKIDNIDKTTETKKDSIENVNISPNQELKNKN